MRQEDYNDMAITPAEAYARRHKPPRKFPKCPSCDEVYMGDGVLPCLVCENIHKEQNTPTERSKQDLFNFIIDNTPLTGVVFDRLPIDRNIAKHLFKLVGYRSTSRFKKYFSKF